MKPFARINLSSVLSSASSSVALEKVDSLRKGILVSSLAFAAGCVSRIDIEHWALEPCDAATTAEIARLVEEGASRDGRVWNNNIPYEERERRRYKLRDGTTIATESSPIRFGTNTVCVAVAATSEGDYIQIADSMFKTTEILGRHRAGWGYILPCAASFGSGEDERLVVVKAPRTYHNWSQVYVSLTKASSACGRAMRSRIGEDGGPLCRHRIPIPCFSTINTSLAISSYATRLPAL